MRSQAPRKFMIVPSAAPLAGIILLLIIIFLGMAPLIGHQLNIAVSPVDLKLAAQGLPPGQIVVRVTSSRLLLNGTPISDQSLAEALSTSLAGQPDPIVVLDASLDLPYERIVYLLDVFRQAGAKSVGLAPDLEAFLNANRAPSPAPQSEGSERTEKQPFETLPEENK